MKMGNQFAGQLRTAGRKAGSGLSEASNFDIESNPLRDSEFETFQYKIEIQILFLFTSVSVLTW